MVPLTNSSAVRSAYWPGSNVVTPCWFGKVPVTSTGPLSNSAPVVISRACIRWWYFDVLSNDIATTYKVPCAPAVRSITGVVVIPIVGVICPHALGGGAAVSPDFSNETCQSCAPVSASKAYTEAFSVTAKTTLCAALPMVNCDRYSGCPSTLPSTLICRSKPKLVELTFAGVSFVFSGYCPVRDTSFLYVMTSPGCGELPLGLTLSLAPLLVTLPAELVTTTVNIAPSSAA